MMLCTKETLDFCVSLAQGAGQEILRHLPREVAVSQKADASPVTEADISAHQYIRQGLLAKFPDIPMISEEGEEFPPQGVDYFWLVDPLDGTKGFLRGEPEYTVNIALIHHRRPVLGVIHLPAMGEGYAGGEALGAWKLVKGGVQSIVVKDWADAGRTVVLSRHHASPRARTFIEAYGIQHTLQVNSSYKFCMVAEGRAHLYPRIGPTMEWDTAAGHAILIGAGGQMVTLEGEPFLYGKPGFHNPGFIAHCKGFSGVVMGGSAAALKL